MNNKNINQILEYAKENIEKISKTKFSYDFDSELYKQGIIEDLKEIKELKISKKNVLDFGCGRGIFTLLLSKIFEKSYGVDIEPITNEKDIDPSGPLYKIQPKIWSIFEKEFEVKYKYYSSKIPFENQKFDCVVAYAVLEHIENKELRDILKEINRVLKKDGILYISRTPRRLSFSERLGKYLRLGVHEKLFGEKEIKEFLEKNGFKILKFKRTDFIPAFSIFKNISNNKIGLHVFIILEKIFLNSPLKYFSHHYRIIARKR